MKNVYFAALAGVVLATGAAIAWAGQGDAQSANLFPSDDAAAVARGQALYAANCASCHGADLEGQENWRTPGPNGRALAPPHDTSGHTWHHPDAQLFQIVKFGTAALVGNGYESDMAGYEGILSDSDIRDTMAFIKSTWPPEIIERHNAMNAAR